MTLHELAANLSSRLCTAIEAEPDGKKERRIAFALEGLISTGYSMLVIFFVSLVLGTVKQTMAALLFAGSLRTFTGGVHARTPTRCALISGVVLALWVLASNIFPGRKVFYGTLRLLWSWQR